MNLTAILNLYKKNITSKNSLNLYLLVMSSKDSSFNSLIDFYATNTNLVINEEVDNKSNKITKGQQFYKNMANSIVKQDNKQQYDVSLWSPIDNYFKENMTILSQKAIQNTKISLRSLIT